jgi:hypothetical protein
MKSFEGRPPAPAMDSPADRIAQFATDEKTRQSGDEGRAE